MRNCILITLILCLGLSQAWAQPVTTQPTEKLEEMGKETIGKYNTWEALDLFKKVYERKQGDPQATFDVAFTYYLLRDYAEAEEWFKKLLDADKDGMYKMTNWYLGLTMKMNGKYAECIPVFEKFKSSYEDSDADKYKTLAQVEIDGAKWAQKVTEPYEELKINNPGKMINAALVENYAYPIGRNKIIFSSLKHDTIINLGEAEEGSQFVKIYTAEKGEEEGAEWKEAQLFNAEVLGAKEAHVVNPTFNKDMSNFYFVKARLLGNMLENSKIYVCTYDGATTGAPLVLDFNDNEYTCKNPAVGMIDGKEYLFFSSNMAGGKGGFDIWYAEINADGTTKTPLNAESINTVGDESHPFYDERDNKMYFASNGHPGMGGIDLFTSLRAKDGTWGKAENMGPGFNTSLDEFGFIINREGNDDCYGYFISNRAGTTTLPGKKTSTDDIWSILMPERCDVNLDVCVRNKETGEEIKGATVQLIDKATGKVVDEQKNTESCMVHFTLEQGKEYEVVAKKEGMESVEPLYVDSRRPALEKRFGSIDNPMSWEEKTMLKEMGLIVEVFNKKTNAPLNGATVIVFKNGNEMVKESTQANSNRHEFKIPRNADYRLQSRLEGYVGESKKITAADMKNVQKLYLTPPPIFVNVLFDFDKSNIRSGAADTLDMVAQVLTEYPDLVVEVRGHTDSRGTNSYNNALSNRRSTSAIQYLIDKGIDKSRLIPKGFGEEEPIAPNETADGQDDPAGRQLNRRVEFKIIKGEATDGTVGDASKSSTTVAEVEKKNQ